MMNKPSPLVPQGSLLDQKDRSRTRVKLAFFCVVGAHVVGLMIFLMAGCKREQPPETTEVKAPDTSLQPTITDSNTAPVQPSNNVVVPPPLPPPPPVPPTPPPAQTTDYTVQKGDSFSTIHTKLGVSVKAIAAANPGVDSTKLKIGQKLVIPAGAAGAGGTSVPSGSAPTTPTPTASGGEQTYTVKSGDNLSKIATHFGTTVKAIQSANSLGTKTGIRVGQKLKIPPGKNASAVPSAPAPEAAPAVVPTMPAPAAAPGPNPGQ